MIISKTPYRISLFGGGSDLPDFYRKYGGRVIGFGINQYSYIFLKRVKKMLGWSYRIVYSKTEIVDKIREINHPSVKECLKFYNIKDGLELTHSGDLPALSGMGSSSSFTVGLCNILKSINNESFDKYDLAYDAINIEQNKIKEFVGSQDQVFASFGGFNEIIFQKDNNIIVNSLNISAKNTKLFEDSALLVFTGKVRYASKIEEKKIKSLKKNKKKQNQLNTLKDLVESCLQELMKKKINIKLLGQMLNDSWVLKRELSQGVTNDYLDNLYDNVIKNGAYGGKLLGAGGGGFFFFLCNPNKKKQIVKNLKLKAIDIKIDNSGSSIIFNQGF